MTASNSCTAGTCYNSNAGKLPQKASSADRVTTHTSLCVETAGYVAHAAVADAASKQHMMQMRNEQQKKYLHNVGTASCSCDKLHQLRQENQPGDCKLLLLLLLLLLLAAGLNHCCVRYQPE